MNDIHGQTLALASLFQSAELIDRIAHGKPYNTAAFDCSIDSLFTLEADRIEQIYGDGEGLIPGLRTLINYFGGRDRMPDRLIIYYVMSMMKLERKLIRDRAMSEQVQQGLRKILEQGEQFDLSPLARLHRIDGLYQETLSRIQPRVIVQGDQTGLSQGDNTSRIRALLFAGVRAAVLWRQRGGSRWKLLLQRRRHVVEAQRLIDRITA